MTERESSGTTIPRSLMEELMLGAGRVRRFTQDTPILPDVWLAYANCLDDSVPAPSEADGRPLRPIKLLLTPYRQSAVGEVRNELCARLRADRQRAEPMPRVVYNQTTVAATLSFADLIRSALPMTKWWHEIAAKFRIEKIDDMIDELALAVEDPEHARPLSTRSPSDGRLPPGLLWMIRVVGALALSRRGKSLPWSRVPRREPGASDRKAEPGWRAVVAAVAELVRGVAPGDPKALIHSISLNREVTPTVSRSTLAVKADAARKLFDISCRDLTWAVVDAGIDAQHPAFRAREHDKPYADPFVTDKGSPGNQTRIVETYDFTQIDLLLDPESAGQPASLARRLNPCDADPEGLNAALDDLRQGIARGRNVDWERIAPLLRVPHEEGKYYPPGNDHGTHVAGILAADWRKEESGGALEDDLVGVCRDLRLFDLRVLDAEGRGDEFAVMAALQFVRHLNAAHDYVVVHGVNLSLSIPHDVANYACGRTAVCDECERVVASGVVVVAAAGNQGYRRYRTAEDRSVEAYNNSSITDPGNAEAVITVGATHRYRPHTYGVSYFSSRGPTGDGRAKPDLVAPGEKIEGPLPDGLFGPKDGTSMAAPHVSGGAAQLMARYNELVGRPARIKEILCATATDLGRERYFQGAGMLDILRALQSV